MLEASSAMQYRPGKDSNKDKSADSYTKTGSSLNTNNVPCSGSM